MATTITGEDKDLPVSISISKLKRLLGRPGLALISVSISLPLILLALVSWQSYDQTIRTARDRAERSVDVLKEHALKVFETHRLAVDQINERLRSVNWETAGGDQALHELLRRLQTGMDQIATITITDEEGRMRASSRIFPADPSISFADRDWFQALNRAMKKALPRGRLA